MTTEKSPSFASPIVFVFPVHPPDALCAKINRTFAENRSDYRIVRSSVDGGGYVFAFVLSHEVRS